MSELKMENNAIGNLLDRGEHMAIDKMLLNNMELKQHKNPLVIYHANCADGFSAAWCFYNAQDEMETSFDFHPGKYGEVPPDCSDRIVYLVDFSYKRDVVKKMCQEAKRVILIDHHKTAIDDLGYLIDEGSPEHQYNFTWYVDIERSGAMLAWDYLHNVYFQEVVKEPSGVTSLHIVSELKPGDPLYKAPPLLLEHIQDRDLWKFKLDGTRPIQAAIFSYEYTFENWDDMMLGQTIREMKSPLTKKMELWQQGEAIERKHLKDIRELITAAHRWMFIGEGAHPVYMPVLNCPYMWGSDAGHIMSNELVHPNSACDPLSNGVFTEEWSKSNAAGVAAYYYDTAEHRIFGLRSADWSNIDVSEIAKQYGGGGHKHAAGFKVPRSHELARF